MSEKFTETATPHGGVGDWGHVDPQEAIQNLRAHYERERDRAIAVLADVEAGRVEVFYQFGPWAMRDRRRVWPIGADTGSDEQ